MKYLFYTLLFSVILGLSITSAQAQTSYKSLDFYTNDLSNEDAQNGFVTEIQKNLKTSTPRAEKVAEMFLQYAKDKNDSVLILNANYQLGVVYFKTAKFDSSLYYIANAVQFAEKNNDSAMLVSIYLTFGAVYIATNQNAKALKNLNLSYDYSVNLNDSIGMAMALNNLSLLSSNSGEYENSLTYLKRALDLKIAYANKSERISTLLNIGSNYAKLKNYDKAIEYYDLAEIIALEFNENQKLAQICLERAMVEVEIKNYESAESYFNKSITVSTDIKDKGQLARTYKTYGEYWMTLGEWKKAKAKLLNVVGSKRLTQDVVILTEVFFDLGMIEFETQQYTKAKYWLNKAIAKSNTELHVVVAETYFLLAKIAYIQNNFQEGYDYLLLTTQIRDSIQKETNLQKLQELQVKYDAENDKEYIDYLVELTALKELESKRSTRYFVISLVVFFITLIAAIALAFQVIQKRKKSRELEAQMEENSKKTRALIDANRRAQEGLRVKSEFIAMVSHEIRTPMNAIIGMGSLLGDTQLNEKQNNYLNNITISSNNLLILLNDILDFSRVESGKVTINIQAADLNIELKHIIEMFTPLAAEKDLDFITDIDTNIPPRVFVDAPRLRQVLVNLLSNAIKFTHTGFVKFSAKITKEESTLNGKKVSFRFSVEDSGIGVPKEKQSEIFSSFKQLDSKVSRQYSGVGLGLSISQGILGMLGSSIELESEFAKGSTFWFDLNLKSLNTSGKTKITQSNSRVKFDKQLGTKFPLRILVAEDNEINQKLIQINLNKIGYNPTIVGNGQEALDQIKLQSFDLVFMDVQMPVMDGVTATKEIVRKYGKNKPIIIAVTANAMGTDKQSYIKAGMDDYISKPYTNSEIEACLRNWYVHLNS